MPYLCVKLCAAPSEEMTRKVVDVLTGLTAEVLKKNRELTSVSVEYISASDWFIGGRPLGAQELATFYLDVKVTEGTNTKDEKAEYVGQVFSAVESLLGRLHPATYIVIHEVRGDAWGYGGLTQEFRYVRGKAL